MRPDYEYWYYQNEVKAYKTAEYWIKELLTIEQIHPLVLLNAALMPCCTASLVVL